MKILFTLSFYFISCCGLLHGQDLKLNAWIQLSTQGDSSLVVTAMAWNLTDFVSEYHYSLVATKTGRSGSSVSKQSSDFTLTESERTTLSSLSLNIKAGDVVRLDLRVHDADGEVAKDSITATGPYLMQLAAPQQEPIVEMAPDSLTEELPAALLEILQLDTTTQESEAEISGLIIDETRTKAGRDFYDQFYTKWVAPSGVDDFTIKVVEFPTRGRVARVGLDVNGTLVFQRVLQPREDILELTIGQAISIVQNHLSEQQQINTQLESEDQAGSGLY